MRVLVIGRGKVGRALLHALREAHVDVGMLAGRSLARSRTRLAADLILLAVPDASIAAVASALAPRVTPNTCVMHCAGARDTRVLQALERRGIATGVLHPLVSFASARKAPALRGATFTAFGDRRSVRVARALTRALSAQLLVLEAPPGPAYHAAAALVANGAAALAEHGVRALQSLGITRRASEGALAGLLRSVADNVARVGVPGALTGPVVRGDAETVGRHVNALRSVERELAEAYAALQPTVLHTARAAGLEAAPARAIVRAVEAALSSPGSRSRPAAGSRSRPRTTSSRATRARTATGARAAARRSR